MKIFWVPCVVIGALATLNAVTGKDIYRGNDHFPNHGRHGSFLVQREGTQRWKFNVRRVESNRDDASKTSNQTCSLCPSPELLSPCECVCSDGNQPEISCGAELSSCYELTRILNSDIFPTSHYSKLKVDGTQLNCKLEHDLWGPLYFRKIVLVNNQFSTLDNNAFLTFNSTLKTLNLDKNKLCVVSFSVLNDLPNLEVFVIQNNEINFIPAYQMMNNSALRVFKASRNLVTSIRKDTFAGLPHLQILDLSHNKITHLSSYSLRILDHRAPSLEINLSFNEIQSIDAEAVSGIKLCSINLRNNQLITLQEKTYRPLIDFTNAHISFTVTENPLICDCSISWIVGNATVEQCFDNFRCPNLNEAVSTITENELGNCTRGHDLARGGHPSKWKMS